MLAQTVTCPNCNAQLTLKAAPVVRTVAKCPKCGGPVTLTPATEAGMHSAVETTAPLPVTTASRDTAPEAGDGTQAGRPGTTAHGEFPFLSPPQQPDEIGRLGVYRVLGELGRGGMGVVFRAEDPHLKRHVALKVMLPQYAANPTDKARFLREARAQAAVEHDHVAAIFQVGEDCGVAFLAMPLLRGQSLADALRANPQVPLAEAVRIAREMADGLAAAHEQHLVHRDIKPANVWLEGKQRRVKILDFGLARAQGADSADAVTQQGAVVGTPAYMSPEQARGELLDTRSDLFSLGVVLYQMLTGRSPFRAPSLTGILIAVATENPPAPESVNPNIPAALGALTMALLAKAAADRPATAEAVAARLREIEAGLGVTGLVAIPVALRTADAPPDPWDAIDATEAEPRTAVKSPKPAAKSAKPVAKNAKPVGGRAKLFVAVGVLALIALVAVLAVVILRVETAEGTLVVEINDPDVEARIKNGKLVLVGPDGKARYTIAPDDRNKTIEAGAYKVRVEGADGLSLSTREFTLKKGEQVTLRVTLESKVVAKKKDPPVTDPDRAAAEYVVSIGGTVRVNDETTDRDTVDKLPRGPFRLRTVTVVDNNRLADAGMVAFRGCKDLTYVNLQKTAVSDAGVAYFKDCKNLTSLSLGSTRVTDEGMIHFKGCTNLTSLSLWDTQVTETGLANFKDCKNLTHIYLSQTRLTDAGLEHFADCKHLTHIQINQTQVTDAGLAKFRDCQNVIELHLSGPLVTDAGVAYFKLCPKLTKLSLTTTKVGNDGLAHFKDCTQLTELILWGTQMTDAGLIGFKDLRQLTLLSVTDTRVGDEGLTCLKECTKLISLYLDRTQVTDAAVPNIKARRSLTLLSIKGTAITAGKINELKEALPNCKIEWDGGIIQPKGK